MTARLYCAGCLLLGARIAPFESSRSVWRFDGRDGVLLRFRLWQAVLTVGEFHATTETYVTAEHLFWAGATKCGRPMHAACACARPAGHPGGCSCAPFLAMAFVRANAVDVEEPCS